MNVLEKLRKFIILGSVIAVPFFGAFWYFYGGGRTYIMSRNARFSCYRTPDPRDADRDIWTVNYHPRNNKKSQPWLYMVREMGGGWDTLKRCDELAIRLTNLATEGLIQINYEPIDPGSDQYQLCGLTQRVPDNCQLLLTLKPGDDPSATIQEIIGGLQTGEGSYQRSDGETSEAEVQWVIDTKTLW